MINLSSVRVTSLIKNFEKNLSPTHFPSSQIVSQVPPKDINTELGVWAIPGPTEFSFGNGEHERA